MRDIFTRDFHILRSNGDVIYAADNLGVVATDAVANPRISSLRVATLRNDGGWGETGIEQVMNLHPDI